MGLSKSLDLGVGWVQGPFMFGALFGFGLNVVSGSSTKFSAYCFRNLRGVPSASLLYFFVSHVGVLTKGLRHWAQKNPAGRASRYPRLRTWVSRRVPGFPGFADGGFRK